MFSRVEKRFLEMRSVFSSGEAFSREDTRFLEWRSVFSSRIVFSSEDAFSLVKKRFLA